TVAVSRTEPLRLNHPSLLVYTQPPGGDAKEWTAPSARERCVAITLRTKFLTDHFLTSIVDTPPQLQALLAGTPGQFQYFQLPLSARAFELANRLVDNQYTGILSLIHTEAVTLELLCAAVAGFASLPSMSNEEYSERDLRCLHAARAFLL